MQMVHKRRGGIVATELCLSLLPVYCSLELLNCIVCSCMLMDGALGCTMGLELCTGQTVMTVHFEGSGCGAGDAL